MHNVEFFTDAQPAGLGTGLVGGGPREELPLDARLQPLQPLVLYIYISDP